MANGFYKSKILIVESDKDSRILVKTRLTNYLCEITETSNKYLFTIMDSNVSFLNQ